MSVWCGRVAASRSASSLCCLWMVYLAGACMSPEVAFNSPDLIAIPDGSFGGSDAYCDMTTVPQLRIVIQNQGQGNASPSTTRVVFSPGGTKDVPTSAIPSGQHVMLAPVPIPKACFDPDCDFTITVDSKAQIDEDIGESNNVVDGRCIQP